MFEGPSLIGMALGAIEVEEKSSMEQAQRMWVPVKGITHSQGNLYDGYTQRTHYKNKGCGDSIVDYEKR